MGKSTITQEDYVKAVKKADRERDCPTRKVNLNTTNEGTSV